MPTIGNISASFIGSVQQPVKKKVSATFKPVAVSGISHTLSPVSSGSINQVPASNTSTPILVAGGNSLSTAPVPELATTIQSGSGNTVAAPAPGPGAVTPTFWAKNKNAILIAAAVIAVIVGFIVYRKIAK